MLSLARTTRSHACRPRVGARGKERAAYWRPGAWLAGGTLGVLSLLLFGCGQDTTGPAPRDAAALAWTLSLNVHAVTLVNAPPHNTVQLVPTVRAASGAAVPGVVTLTYQTTDPSSAVVDATGLVTARGATNEVLVTASATVAGVTVRDTATIAVKDAAVVGTYPELPTQLVLQVTQNPLSPLLRPVPTPGMGPTVDCESDAISLLAVQLTPQVTTTNGATVANVPVDYRSSDPYILTVNPTSAQGTRAPSAFQPLCLNGRTGPVIITATATVYGVPLRDSVRVNVAPPLVGSVAVLQRVPQAAGRPVNYFNPGTLTIGTGGIVLWGVHVKNISGSRQDSTIDVVFDTPPAPPQAVDTLALGKSWRSLYPYPLEPAGGDIASFSPTASPFWVSRNRLDTASYRARQFPTAGTYHYHSARYGTAGTILVRPWSP